jgi:hypothetical protein
MNGIKEFLADERGVAWEIAIIVIVLIVGTAVYIVCTPVVNVVSAFFDTQVDLGIVSIDTANCFTFNRLMFRIMPLFVILGLFLYGISQAIFHKKYEGG